MFPQHSPRGRSLQWPWSTLAPFLQSPAGGLAHPLFSSRSSALPIQKYDGLPSNVLARKIRYLLHYFEHSRDGILQDIRLFVQEETDILENNLFIELGRQRENALQPIEKSRHHPIVFALFLQELNSQVSPLLLIHQQRARSSNRKVAIPTMTFAAGVGSN
jgi:hypothetical protein